MVQTPYRVSSCNQQVGIYTINSSKHHKTHEERFGNIESNKFKIETNQKIHLTFNKYNR